LEEVEFKFLFKMFRESEELNEDDLNTFFEVIMGEEQKISLNLFRLAFLILE